MIESLLIANRGEIARRITRTARALGIRCVAVYVDADADAPFVRDADEAFRLPGNYLDGASIITAAKATGATAVHPGYGFLSENPGFAQAVIDAGLVWVGPSPDVVASMGDKLTAKRLAVAAGVPILTSSDDPTAGEQVGFPLLVKAAAGGGGKGMRIVESPGELSEAVAAARREALAAFGDDRVFLERYVRASRHVEIQIVGDSHGNVFHLGERECSIQRRHQKIIEESPSPVMNSDLLGRMSAAAMDLARSIGYQSVGTVEFLLDDTTREFFFLEVNTRLQVEHPVTEQVTGFDLVGLQLAVAAGETLDIVDVPRCGHAIEARLYAEDTAAGFLPATGTLAAFAPALGDDIRWDSGVEQGSVVGLDFDPMLAKVVAWGTTRTIAAQRLALALERLHLGGVTTNRDFLVATLRNPAFLAGDTTTDFIERVRPQPHVHDTARAATVAALWLQGLNRAKARVLSGVPSGWRNGRLPDQQVTLTTGDTSHTVSYRARRDGTFTIGDRGSARIYSWTQTEIDVEVDARRSVHLVTSDGSQLHVQLPTGTVSFDVEARFRTAETYTPAGSLMAPMPGLVIDVRCRVGDRVNARQTLLVLEAMKMEHHISAPEEGIVGELRVAQGDRVDNGALLLVLHPVRSEESST